MQAPGTWLHSSASQEHALLSEVSVLFLRSSKCVQKSQARRGGGTRHSARVWQGRLVPEGHGRLRGAQQCDRAACGKPQPGLGSQGSTGQHLHGLSLSLPAAHCPRSSALRHGVGGWHPGPCCGCCVSLNFGQPCSKVDDEIPCRRRRLAQYLVCVLSARASQGPLGVLSSPGTPAEVMAWGRVLSEWRLCPAGWKCTC